MRRAAIALAVLATIVAGGCADQGNPPLVEEREDVLLEEPCTLFTESDLEAIFDRDVGEGAGSAIEVTEGGEVYRASECQWSNAGVDVVLQVARADDFAGGEVVCRQPTGGEVEPVTELGEQAWWLMQEREQEGGVTGGLLRACTESVLVNVVIGGAVDDPQTLQAQALSVAEVVLTAAAGGAR